MSLTLHHTPENTCFIEQHAQDDVHALALQSTRFPDIDMPFCLQQIAGRQQAAKKLPTWIRNPHLIFPPRLNIEQCSSEATAHYKALLMLRLWKEVAGDAKGVAFVDATGGFGVDFVHMADMMQNADEMTYFVPHYVDVDEELCTLARHNFPHIGLRHAVVHQGDGITVLNDVAQQSHSQGHKVLAFIDPSRRDHNGKRTYAIADCTPDVQQYHDDIMSDADACVVKLSPMVDWHAAVQQLPATREVHIVSTNNECKELLLVLKPADSCPLTVYCVNDDQSFVFEYMPRSPQSVNGEPSFSDPLSLPQSALYLYEPNASVMKAGCFAEVARAYDIRPVSKDSHLYLSERKIPGFIGRSFVVNAVTPMKKSMLKQMIKDIASANVAVRNFPLSATQLQEKLHLKDGGDVYIFGTTTSKGQPVLLSCKKM